MEVVYRRCCVMAVHKETVAACVLRWEEGGQVRKEKKVFGTMTRSLHELAAGLSQHEVTHVAMEATGVYWEPVWNVLEGQFQLLLINPEHYKGLRGKKTDLKDGERIGELLQHGWRSGSFVPPREMRAWRGLTRHRASLAQERVRGIQPDPKTVGGCPYQIGLCGVRRAWLVRGRHVGRHGRGTGRSKKIG